MSTLELCEKYFGTRDIYKLFEIAKDAPPKDVKKAYYKLSLQVHPDRVNAAEKDEATEKFKVLSKIYQVLGDKDRRALYDEQGIIDDDNDALEGKLNNWLELWRKLFKPLTIDDISNYEKSYKGSELERTDIRKAYLSGKGCKNHMMNEVPFLKVEDEPRIQQIVEAMIASGEVPEYKQFTNEPAQKRKRRHQKYAKESKEAEEIKQELLKNKRREEEANGDSLEMQIMRRQQSRESGFNTLMDKLMEKYGGSAAEDDDSDVVDFDKLKKLKKKAKTSHTSSKSKGTIHQVKNGKVKKN